MSAVLLSHTTSDISLIAITAVTYKKNLTIHTFLHDVLKHVI